MCADLFSRCVSISSPSSRSLRSMLESNFDLVPIRSHRNIIIFAVTPNSIDIYIKVVGQVTESITLCMFAFIAFLRLFADSPQNFDFIDILDTVALSLLRVAIRNNAICCIISLGVGK